MSRKKDTLFIWVVTVLTVSVTVGAVAGQVSGQEAQEQGVSPGEILTGVLGSQNADVEGEVERRAVSDAGVEGGEGLSKRLDRVGEKLDYIDERQKDLREMLEDGEISESAYRSRMSVLDTQLENTERTLNLISMVSEGFDEEARDEIGVTEDRIESLSRRADGIVKNETMSAVANRGAERASERRVSVAGDRVEGAEDHVERAGNTVETRRGRESVESAVTSIDRAQDALNEAESALDDGRYRDSMEFASTAVDRAGLARSYAEKAIEAEYSGGGEDEDGADEIVEHADDSFEGATDAVERARIAVENNEEARSMLERAEEALERADHELTSAREAVEEGDDVAARRYAQSSIGYSKESETLAERAVVLEDRGQDSERGGSAREAISDAEEELDSADDDIKRAAELVADEELLDRARNELGTGETALSDAREAFANEEYAEAENRANTAVEHAKKANELAQRAARDDGDETGAEWSVEISDSDSTVTAGERIRVEVIVRNTGDSDGRAGLSVGSPELDGVTRQVALDAGGRTTKEVRIRTSSDDIGTHQLVASVEGTMDEETVRVVQGEAENPNFNVEITDTGSPVAPTEELWVEMRVENTGEATGTYEVTVWGLGLNTVEVTLDPGEETTERMVLEKGDQEPEPGTYEIQAEVIDDGATDTERVEVEER